MAQPEFTVLADTIRSAIDNSEPVELGNNRWHTPYLRDDDMSLPVNLRLAISAGRVARTSYVNQNGVRSIDDDIGLFVRLATDEPAHAAPFEHITGSSDFSVGSC